MNPHDTTPPKGRISPSSVYYCPMECEGEKVYFQPGKRCPVCNMFLVPIEEKAGFTGGAKTFETEITNPEEKIGEFFCPMFCEGGKTYPEDTGCQVCHMHLQEITPELIEKNRTTEKPSSAVLNHSQNAGKYYCPMFCEGDKVYDSNVGCPVCGMDLVQIPGKPGEVTEDETVKILAKKFWIALCFTMPVLLLSMGSMVAELPFSGKIRGMAELFLSLPVVFYAGWFLLKRGYISFKTGNLNMFSLIALGVTAAFLFSLATLFFPEILPGKIAVNGEFPLYFEAVCVILTLVILGQLLEAKAHQKTGKAIEELMNLSPGEANLVTGGGEQKIMLDAVKIGDILRVKPGEKIPVDGTVTDGKSTVDESMITGEPVPAEKKINEKVSAGTLNGSGTFLMIAEKVGNETLLAKIIEMVNTAGRSRAPIQKMTDKVAKIFVPAVIAVSAATFVAWYIFGGENRLTFALINAVSVLIVACPCALGLATPMSLMVGIGKGARNGILIKNAEALEEMHRVNVLIIDKTGTLTEGKPSLAEIKATDYTGANEIVTLAAALSQNSAHPLSSAILQASDPANPLPKAENFENISGKGVKGTIGTDEILLGNEKLMQQFSVEIPPNFKPNKDKTISYLAKNKRLLGVLSFTDKIKKTSAKAVQFLQNNGIEVIMMTGDHEATARTVAAETGITKYFFGALPQDKMQKIIELQNNGKIVAMAGDGINDAPALAQANVGIAMGTGSAAAIESAGITLVKGDILGVVKSKILSERLLKNIKQNLFFAFIYNALGIPVAAGLLYPFFGILLSPMLAAAAMSCSSLSVILNSLRLNGVQFTQG